MAFVHPETSIRITVFVSVTLLAFSLLCTPVTSRAQDISSAENLLLAMDMDNQLQKSIEQMLQLQIQQNPSIAPFKNIMLDYLNKYMSFEQLKPDLIEIYNNAYSESELQELIAFYKTPVGEKTSRLLPRLMTEGAQLGATRVQANIAELEQNIAAEARRLEAENSE